MENSERPGGLTFFSIINFIIAALYIIGACMLLLSVAFIDQVPVENLNEMQRMSVDALKNMPTSSLIFAVSKGVIGFILLILAGIGYLKQKKVLGYIMGNTYAVVMIIYTVITPFILGAAGKSGAISYSIALLYPVITLIVLNLLYRKNLSK